MGSPTTKGAGATARVTVLSNSRWSNYNRPSHVAGANQRSGGNGPRVHGPFNNGGACRCSSRPGTTGIPSSSNLANAGSHYNTACKGRCACASTSGATREYVSCTPTAARTYKWPSEAAGVAA